MEKITNKLGILAAGKKIKVLVITILLLTSGLAVIGLVPNFFGAVSTEEAVTQNDLDDDSSRCSRSTRGINYDMNTSRTGRHQDVTVFGRRAQFPAEIMSPFNCSVLGDVNNDGYDDLLIGAPGDNISLTEEDCGVIYVIFGKATLPSTYDLANQTELIIQGMDAFDYEGTALTIGDINGDGIGTIGRYEGGIALHAESSNSLQYITIDNC